MESCYSALIVFGKKGKGKKRDSLRACRSESPLDEGGWPIGQGTFLPYGQEWNPQITSNHYKFTGKERDSEDNLDYFGARYYSSTNQLDRDLFLVLVVCANGAEDGTHSSMRDFRFDAVGADAASNLGR